MKPSERCGLKDCVGDQTRGNARAQETPLPQPLQEAHRDTLDSIEASLRRPRSRFKVAVLAPPEGEALTVLVYVEGQARYCSPTGAPASSAISRESGLSESSGFGCASGAMTFTSMRASASCMRLSYVATASSSLSRLRALAM